MFQVNSDSTLVNLLMNHMCVAILQRLTNPVENSHQVLIGIILLYVLYVRILTTTTKIPQTNN